ncbi:hypothetical protein [Tepidibacter aestuarii]|uniref:hypothetical protein n=1 Tax=Tepidibacter aestuarii TaxID=2925782 RepID=UPI0020C08C51|nr:hypothetical protein [Tepidibacter aestuarii]
MIKEILETAFLVESSIANTYKSNITLSFNLIEEYYYIYLYNKTPFNKLKRSSINSHWNY